ncbi:hypothetical protein [Tautonia plasticadhaerens]|uniref:hypothetical protein n=1 Tax=Tautonia plasticadhaerens TaxID=2527974 RepID=UPI0011AA28D3|nr:hypothetical protein [Tautonia plasticadhaerens]
MIGLLALAMATSTATAGVGDPQVSTDHPWYPGELACSTFDRLFASQAVAFERLMGRPPGSDEDRSLASWLWRSTHYWHGQPADLDLWGFGFGTGPDPTIREYWTGLFAFGFGLCGTTHAQWCAEIEELLGHARGRVVGVRGHNSFEAWLTGGPYGGGRWALLDHDICTVVFDPEGRRLLSIPEIRADLDTLADPSHLPDRQRGWPLGGLHPDDPEAYDRYTTAEYLAGYASAPPMVHLRRGEVLRRYPEPGLDDGRTFAFWGLNDRNGDLPGPERSRTFVNQPDRVFRNPEGSGYRPGQARFANAVYRYAPDFGSGDYREGVVAEDESSVTFSFSTPYVIAASPPDDEPWGVLDDGCRNGLVVRGWVDCPVSVSIDDGRTWLDAGRLDAGALDLTDLVKGRQHYLIRFGAGAEALADAGLSWMTVCQANSSVLPRLTDDGSAVTFLASGRAVTSAGPVVEHARTHLVSGSFDSPRATLSLSTPSGEKAVAVHASAHVRSGNPPDPEVTYAIDCSTDGGISWRPLASDWAIPRRGEEPDDFWSQSFCWGSAPIGADDASSVLVRFSNTGGKPYARCEAQLVYQIPSPDWTRVTFAWSDDSGDRSHAEVVPGGEQATWVVPTGSGVQTRWVEFEPVAGTRE